MTGKRKILLATIIAGLLLSALLAGAYVLSVRYGDWRAVVPYRNTTRDRYGIALRTDDRDAHPLLCKRYGMFVKVQWRSGDESIAALDGKNFVTGISRGETYIYAEYKGKEVLRLPVYVDRESPEPLGEIADPRFVQDSGTYINHDASASNEAVLRFAGDLMCMASLQKAAMTDGVFNFKKFFRHVRPLLWEADFSMGNLETMLSHTWPYNHELSGRLEAPYLNAPPTYLDAVRYAGFDAVSMANNHNADVGWTGIVETMEHIKRYSLLNTGLFLSEDDPRYLLVDINGIRVAILSYSDVFNSAPVRKNLSETERTLALNVYEMSKVKDDVTSAKAKGAEYIIMYIHWGGQNNTTLTKRQPVVAREMADAGIDYIIGMHPHVLQKYDVITAEDGRSVPVVYSLGNFIGSAGAIILNRDAAILQLELKRGPNGVIQAKDCYIPCFLMQYEDVPYTLLPCDPELNGGYSFSSLTDAWKRIADTLGDKISAYQGNAD